MKKVINGRMYNTETATRIARRSNNLPSNDMNRRDEDLYLKRNGEYFIEWYGGDFYGYKIIPITVEEAKQWADESLRRYLRRNFRKS